MLPRTAFRGVIPDAVLEEACRLSSCPRHPPPPGMAKINWGLPKVQKLLEPYAGQIAKLLTAISGDLRRLSAAQPPGRPAPPPLAKRRRPTLTDVMNVVRTLWRNEGVSPERRQARLRICYACSFIAIDRKGIPFCRLCGCRVRKKRTLIDKLHFEEREGVVGCPHPDGSQWRANNV